MKKVLSVVLALSMLISAFALTSVASADAVDVTIFQPTFGGRKGFSTETWGQAMNIEVNGKKIEDIIAEKVATIGEKISFRRFEKIEKSADV